MLSDEGLRVTRVLAARAETVWRAWTEPDLMARWFFPGERWTTRVEVDLRVGGRYELAMRDEGGGQHLQFGVYREVVPISRLVFTWSCPELGVTDSLVTLQLRAVGVDTELSLVHVLPADPKVRAGHDEGWGGCLGNLERYLAMEKAP
jgi:uncharacterized protein YndB with AHSA1/START domain